MVDEGERLLEKRFKSNGYSVGINVGSTAGQTVMHCHIHLIPRRLGDSINPCANVRGVTAGKADYLRFDEGGQDCCLRTTLNGHEAGNGGYSQGLT
jgi:diadenosine tetraphosphate (Ap4A) HIT family hydrolase